MSRALLSLMALMAVLPFARAAEESFSQAVAPADFSASGLAKLSAEELARLDVLVRDYKSGALAAARRDAMAAEKARAAAESRAAKAEADAQGRAAAAPIKSEPPKPSLLAKAKVLLTPGTEVEYSAIESRIVGDFRGWDGPTVFRLENGQRWQAAGTTSYISPAIAAPAVKIAPGALGTFWMSVEGVSPRVKVKLLGDGR